MTNEQMEAQLARITSRVDSLPCPERTRLIELIEETRRRHRDIQTQARRSLAALDDWRLAQKYLIFDFEARLRETRDRAQGTDETHEE